MKANVLDWANDWRYMLLAHFYVQRARDGGSGRELLLFGRDR